MKKWYTSKTIVSTLILAIALLKSLSGVELLSNDEIVALGTTVETVVTGIFGLIAIATAIHGRVTAKGKITL